MARDVVLNWAHRADMCVPQQPKQVPSGSALARRSAPLPVGCNANSGKDGQPDQRFTTGADGVHEDVE